VLKKKIIAIIPARKGSKGIKNKNILKIDNMTIVEHAINSAKKSKYIDFIAVSTDSKKIQKISKKQKVWCEYLRPKKISHDQSSTYDAVKFVLNKINNKFSYIIELHPPHIFRSHLLIDQAIEIMMNNKNFDSLISVIPVKDTAHPDYIISLKGNKINYKKSPMKFNRHFLAKKFRSSGIILISKYKSFLKNKSMVGKKCYGFIIYNDLSTFDINNKIDYMLAKTLWVKKNEYYKL
jgi:CMP-N-acetylneuraminic acid synthetase